MALSTRNVVTGSGTEANTASATKTLTYTVGSGTQLLAVAARWEGNDSTNLSITAVRWADSGGANEEALTQAVYRESTAAGEDVGLGWYYLVNPTARAGQVEVDYEVTGGADFSSWSITAIEVIGGVDTASPIGVTDSASGNATSAGLPVTSTVANSLILSSVIHYGGDTDPFTPHAGITAELVDGATGTNAGSDHGYWVGECLTTTVGTYNCGASAAVADDYSVAAIEIKPSASDITGTLSKTQAGDSASSSATLAITGSASGTQAADSLSASATLAITGSVDKAQAGDSLSASASLAITGSLSATQAGNTLAATEGGQNTGELAITQAGNTLSASATLAITGSLAAAASGDSLSATGSGAPPEAQTGIGGWYGPPGYLKYEKRRKKRSERAKRKEVAHIRAQVPEAPTSDRIQQVIDEARARGEELSRLDAEILLLWQRLEDQVIEDEEISLLLLAA